MLQETGLPLFNQGIRRFIAFQRAALQGLPVYEVKDGKAATAWDDYIAVGKEVFA
jgi:chromosome partitioning protein